MKLQFNRLKSNGKWAGLFIFSVVLMLLIMWPNYLNWTAHQQAQTLANTIASAINQTRMQAIQSAQPLGYALPQSLGGNKLHLKVSPEAASKVSYNAFGRLNTAPMTLTIRPEHCVGSQVQTIKVLKSGQIRMQEQPC